ncbi:MOSC N-terminal beta barrel domain-containing protein [Streptomyces oryzae]|uniref:MOSC N-terminal beta barrel domain-containing protein n=1 Tax=Streptomyces oryzae TaxID=1434886 RepID=A0ABS3XHL7_9ACTN|nr:MOSC N-terminal beta barrel domain-containing protein [Streptomyces oryzae]MBO8194876.1 MOSC N-terminal beta barrel domain-containing protein [Streptomyces oryzae]
MAEVVELAHYPVKGCAAVTTTSAAVQPAGLTHDRAFMVISPQGVGRTQRRDPKLAAIRPEVSATGPDGERLTLRAPGVEALHVDVELAGERREVDMLGRPLRGIDQGADAAEWLTEVLGVPSRLVRVPPENGRVTDGLTPGTSAYADSSAVHLVSRATLDALNARLAERGAAPLPMARFRPNIVVDGWDAEPHAEDGARLLRAGDAELGFAKLAVRCAVTLVEPGTGNKAGPEPLRTLATYRRSPAGGVTFGAKFSVVRPGALAVGDKVDVTTWADREPA